ncbi:MAG: pentapeptide repeat-containing protein [Algicola sp.]|nr:pentapeptide repeat-containing protein [Algicola sp.]
MTRDVFFQSLRNDIIKYLMLPLWRYTGASYLLPFLWYYTAADLLIPWLWKYSGLAFIAAKATASENKENHPTLPLWICGIYCALFGLATQHYENLLDRYENRLNTYITQLDTQRQTAMFQLLIDLQRYALPVEPDFWHPIRTMKSLITDPQPIADTPSHQNKVSSIASIIVSYKHDLGCHQKTLNELWRESPIFEEKINSFNITDATKCRFVSLGQAILVGVSMNFANLEGVALFDSDLTKASLHSANLIKTMLAQSNLYGADLRGSFLYKANLAGANLFGANLKFVKGLDCASLQRARNWQLSYRDKDLACGASIPVNTHPPEYDTPDTFFELILTDDIGWIFEEPDLLTKP